MSTPRSVPQRIDYRRAAFDGTRVTGVLGLADVPRTRAVCVENCEADIAVEIGFSEDMQRRVTVEGRAYTTLQLACQRCLAPADVAIDTTIRGMAVASDEAAAGVPRDWEPMLAEGQTLDLHDLVDDELLLAMPITVVCDRPECRAAFEQREAQDLGAADTASQDKENPFAALAALKTGNDETSN